MSSRSPSARRCGPSKNTQVPFRLPRSRTTSAPFSHETFACSGERNTSSVKRMSPSNRPIVVSGPGRWKRWTVLPASSNNTSTMALAARGGAGPVAGDGRAGIGSMGGTPHVGQNLGARRRCHGRSRGRRSREEVLHEREVTVCQSIRQIDASKGSMLACAPVRWLGGMVTLCAVGCATSRTGVAPARPTTAPARAPLQLSIVYPGPTDVIQAHDSSFLFGAVRGGTGPVTLTLNGTPVRVFGHGAWIAWVSLPDDTVAVFRLVARAGGDSALQDWTARIAPRFRPPAGRAAWIDTTSFAPAGTVALPLGEGIRLDVRAAPGATVWLRLPWGAAIPFLPHTLPAEPAWGVRAFATVTAAYRLPPAADRYVAWLPAAALCPDGKAACATLEVTAGRDTATARWPLSIGLVDMTFPSVVVLNDDTVHVGTTDSLTPGKAVPGGTYNWFFPTGTTSVLSGRWNDQVRLQLSQHAVAWVNASDVVPLPAGTPPAGGVVGSVRLEPGPAAGILRVPLPGKLPFQVTEQERSLTLRVYGAGAGINWMQYGRTDPLVTRMSYAQPTADEVTITLDLARRVWGYPTPLEGRDLLVGGRRPPPVDARHPPPRPTIVLDPRPPPFGAKGPTGVCG